MQKTIILPSTLSDAPLIDLKCHRKNEKQDKYVTDRIFLGHDYHNSIP